MTTDHPDTDSTYVDEVRFFTRREDDVNRLLDGEWVLLAAGVNPEGDATYVLGHATRAELADVLGPILEHCDTHWQYRPAVAKARRLLDAATSTS